MSDSFVTPWTVACQAPLSMGFPRQEYRSGLPFPSLGDLPREVNPRLLLGKQILYHRATCEAQDYCTVRLKMFCLFVFMYYFCEKYYKSIYIGVPSKLLVGYLGYLC